MSRSNSRKRRHHKKLDNERPVCVASGKFCHNSRKRALGAMNAVRAAPPGNGTRMPIAVYQCPSCNAWHLTSKEQV